MRKVLLLVSLVTLTGCQSTWWGYTIAKRDSIDRRIAEARIETENKINALKGQELGLLNQVIAAHKTREQEAANYLFKGVVVFGGLKADSISRPTLIMGQSINKTAAQLPSATPAAQAETLKTLQTELDEVKTSTASLLAQYEKDLASARTKGEAAEKQIAQLDSSLKEVEKAKAEAIAMALTKERALQEEKDKVQDAELAKSKQSEHEAKRNEALKRWLMAGLGVIALAAGAAAVFVPVPAVKQYGIAVAIIAGGLGFAVPFIEPMHVLIAMGVVIVGAGLMVVKAFKTEHSDNTDTVRALQEVKTRKPEVFKELTPILKEWHDPKASQRIDQRLKEVGDA